MDCGIYRLYLPRSTDLPVDPLLKGRFAALGGYEAQAVVLTGDVGFELWPPSTYFDLLRLRADGSG